MSSRAQAVVYLLCVALGLLLGWLINGWLLP